MITKQKSLGYWLGVVVTVTLLLGSLATAITWKNNIDTEVAKIPAFDWDMRIVKGVLCRVYPKTYDSVISDEFRMNGQRPENKGATK